MYERAVATRKTAITAADSVAASTERFPVFLKPHVFHRSPVAVIFSSISRVNHIFNVKPAQVFLHSP